MRNYKERTERISEKVKTEKKRRARRRNAILISVISCATAFVIAFNLLLFVPYSVGGYDIAKYKGSEYYELIDRIYELNCPKPRKTNNFEQWGLGDILKSVGDEAVMSPQGQGGAQSPNDSAPSPDASAPGASAPDASDGSSSSGGSTYEEVTNNQVAGVTEGDLFKRSSDYVYYLGYEWNSSGLRYVLRTYDIAKEDTKLVSKLFIQPEADITYRGYQREREMYLSEDCKTITLISTCYVNEKSATYTEIVNVDVSNAKAPAVKERVYVSGSYVSSRLVDGKLLLATNFTVRYNPDFEDPAQYLPQYGRMGNMETLPMNDIVLPETAQTARYSVTTYLSANDLAVRDCLAFFSYTQEIYVSETNLFASHLYSPDLRSERQDGYYQSNYTDITCVEYGKDGLTLKGTVTAPGSIVNQYSMDEYKGVLRVFTTSRRCLVTHNGYWDSVSLQYGKDECNLYCFDLSTFESVAKVENFAPEGESVKSARFMGDTAYVCTAVTVIINTDPVFEFDLSDYENIRCWDTGTIPGYSLSLIPFKNDTLLGIGYGERNWYMKVEIYAREGNAVQSLASYECDANFATEFKSYFIDAETGLIGIAGNFKMPNPADGYSYPEGMLLLRYDGERLVEAGCVYLDTYDYNEMRACLVDGYLYVFCNNNYDPDNFRVVKI